MHAACMDSIWTPPTGHSVSLELSAVNEPLFSITFVPVARHACACVCRGGGAGTSITVPKVRHTAAQRAPPLALPLHTRYSLPS
jgi:hypothetical protein